MGACISIPSILEDTYTLRCIKDESEFEIIKNNDKIHFIYKVVDEETNLHQILFSRGEDQLFELSKVTNTLPKNKEEWYIKGNTVLTTTKESIYFEIPAVFLEDGTCDEETSITKMNDQIETINIRVAKKLLVE